MEEHLENRVDNLFLKTYQNLTILIFETEIGPIFFYVWWYEINTLNKFVNMRSLSYQRHFNHFVFSPTVCKSCCCSFFLT